MSQGTKSRNMRRSVRTGVTNSSDPFESTPNLLAKARPRGTFHLDPSPSFGRGLENIPRFPSANGDLCGGKMKPTLQTCVVVPDNPHRFDLLPLNKVGKLSGQSEPESAHLLAHLPVPLKHQLPPSPSGRSIGAYAQTRSLQPSGSVLSLDKSAMNDVRACDSYNASSPPPKATGRYSKDAPRSADYHSGRQVLYPLDLNQHQWASPKASEEKSTSSLYHLHKTTEPRAQSSTSTSSRTASQNRFRSESLSSQATRSSNHHYRSTLNYSNHTAPNPNLSSHSTLASAVQLSSDMPSLRRPHTLRSAPLVATSKREHAKNEAKLKRRHAVYHTVPFKIEPDDKLVSLSKSDRDASDSENGKSTASICGSPRPSRTHEPAKQESSHGLDYQEAIATNSLRQDNTPKKSILKNASQSTPKATLSTKSLSKENIPRSKSSQFRLLPPMPLQITKKPREGPKPEYRARKPGSPHPFLDMFLLIDELMCEWERR
ncbi:hypothetical protein CPB83DRAFT_901974 [Crepidotus variabilis]|uniref:Uncharacterized protein n=1 Tax=Crepidotus variabilis TaxID=179855 RepID=A0A9P6ETG5_9AGAR|nr:hypothetical protein CPB83DRAFT_901974 [Crepidotus variabilis]